MPETGGPETGGMTGGAETGGIPETGTPRTGGPEDGTPETGGPATGDPGIGPAAAQSCAVAQSGAVARAAPIATLCAGCGSTVAGTCSSAEIIWRTSGMREDPPVSRIVRTSIGLTPAARSARWVAAIVSASAGAIMPSSSERLSRTRMCRPGSATGMCVSVSSESASLASTQSRRSRASAAVTTSSSGSSRVAASPSAAITWPKTASSKSMPPRCSMPSGGPSKLEPVLRLAQHGRVERAAAEVVDRDHLAGADPLARGVRDRRGLGLAAHPYARQPGHPHGLVEQVALERPPVGRMGDRHRVRRPALLRGHGLQHLLQQPGHERLGGVGPAADQHGHRVADPALELAGQPARVGAAAPLGRLADQHRAVGLHVDQRRDLRAAGAQRRDVDATVPAHGGRRVGGAEIDTQPVAHPASSRRCAVTVLAARTAGTRAAAETTVSAGEGQGRQAANADVGAEE